ncbi:hypothetical protein [Caudoviricetes sp.]|nr:hypothetical protein [Caudoviricetes sp.]
MEIYIDLICGVMFGFEIVQDDDTHVVFDLGIIRVLLVF